MSAGDILSAIPVAAMTVKAAFDVVMTVLVILFLFKGGIKLAGAWNERQADDRLWGIIGGIGQAVAIPVIWAIMEFAGWAPQISNSATALP
jgi:hypothetical protein